MSQVIEVTKSGYRWILTQKGTSQYRRSNGKVCSRRSYLNSAKSEPGGAGQVKRYDRAYELYPPDELDMGEAGVYSISQIGKWSKDRGAGHIGIADIEVGSP